MSEQELRLQLLKDVLASCADTYRENTRIGAVLEDKAQKAGAFAGLFLAAAFGFARSENLAEVYRVSGNWGISLMILCVLCFLSSVFTCLLVMWVRTSSGPPNPAQILQVSNALLNLPPPLVGEKSENHVRDQIEAWLSVLKVQTNVNGKKASRLAWGQRILAAGMLLLSVLLVLLTVNAALAHR